MGILEGRNLKLEEFEERHIDILFEWRNSDDFQKYCSTRRNLVSREEFASELHADLVRDNRSQYLIFKGNECIGTIYSYKLNRTDGHAFITVFIAREWRKKGFGAEAVVLFLDTLFRAFDLYKIYVEAYAYNLDSLRALRGAGFVEEGRFCGHRLFEGKRYDLVRFAFFRSQLIGSRRLVRRLTEPREVI